MEILNIQWEYKTIFIQPNTIIVYELNKVGSDGWECFAMNFTNVGTQCFCKRPKIADNQFTPARQINDKPLGPDTIEPSESGITDEVNNASETVKVG